ncbi:MAG: 4-hydroxy-tetrahydrodipicolinate synthase [Ignavibacteriae bacterium]|nr:4-hydroxy-tetrahydrodipicolinate synthase [Ignavibacteriota bacterium]
MTTFIGTATAIVTPFLPDESIDFDSLGKLIDFQIEQGIEGIVPCGSTGEAATMSHQEKVAVIRFAVERVAGRVKVIAGTGSNDTRATIILTRTAKELGADGVLLVAPYYNKPTQNGFFEHFRAIAEAVHIPQIIYNVPGRTGSNILAETQLRIAESSTNIIATKEASASLEQMMEIIANAPSHFSVLSGDDSLALPVIACGGKGVIAVISNYAPKRFGDLVRAALNGNYAEARRLQYGLLTMMKLNFIESNPIPVKFILSQMGMISEQYRLPLTPASVHNKAAILKGMKECGIE